LKCPSLYPGARNKITPRRGGVFSANAIERYAFILVTTPAPPILPPSRIAKRNRSFIAIEATSFTLNVAVEQLPGLHGVVSNFKSVRKKGKGSPRVEWGITDFTYSTDRATVPPVFPPGGAKPTHCRA